VAKLVAPLRVVHFFRWGVRATFDPLYFVSNQRARSGYDWKQNVQEASALVPIILLDARTRTELVGDEAIWSLAPELVERTLYLAKETSPVIEQVASKLGIELPATHVVDPEIALGWVRPLRVQSITRRAITRGTVRERLLIGTRRKASSPDNWMCAELRRRLTQETSISAEEVNEHIDGCPDCRLESRSYARTSLATHAAIDPQTIPFTSVTCITGPIHWDRLRSIAADEKVNVIVLVGDSPGGRQPYWMVDIIKLFALDPQLGLVVERDPTWPILLNPLIAVRSELIRNWNPGCLLLSDLARALAQRVGQSPYKVRYERVIEIPTQPKQRPFEG
jgi:hypothetical protein